MAYFLKPLFLITLFSIFITSCGEDNDDFVLPEDVSNVILEQGIVFGLVDRECAAVNRTIDDCNRVFRYTGNQIVATDILEGIPADETWTFSSTNLGVLNLLLARGLENLPRALRDFDNTSIAEFQQELEGFTNFYVLEYTTPAGRKTIQFQNVPPSASEEVKIYFNEIIKITSRIDK